ncbi:3-oxoadipate CoA-transferase subunit A [Geodia barretti]|uniref:3-oxoadipate CoA-transferase subunit A n=1 Tax=Geodia barretti TaxID=519541 RepID=A0AA35XLJ7_GEOBA|nr:3-oxoadipate CoA-transferase subunit A [Geodia barretti]
MLVGGFGGHHLPDNLLGALVESGAADLTIICQGAGVPTPGRTDIHALVEGGLVRKLVSPLPFDPRQGGSVKQRWEAGQLELEVQPVGVLVERIRAGGAGIGGSFLPTGAGTRFAEGQEVRVIDGREHIFQTAIKADFALLRAAVSDTLGNLVYSGTGRNWNPVMAMAAGVTVAEVDEIREPGGIDPETVITPAIFVQRIVLTS